MIAFWNRRSTPRIVAGAAIAASSGIVLAGATWIAGLAADIDTLLLIRLLLLPLLATTIVVTRWFDRMPLAWVGLGIDPWTLRHAAAGLGIGVLAATVAWSPTLLLGEIQPIRDVDGSYSLLLATLLLSGAVSEELVFRGYIYQRAIELIGPTPVGQTLVTVVFSGLFALAHWGNPAVTPLAMVNLFLGGLFFSIAYLRTGSLWAPIAAHAAWNIFLAMGVGASVSGIDFGHGPLLSMPRGPEWLDGGDFGPEGGLAGTVGLMAGIVAMLRWKATELSPYLHARVFRAVLSLQRGDRSGE